VVGEMVVRGRGEEISREQIGGGGNKEA